MYILDNMVDSSIPLTKSCSQNKMAPVFPVQRYPSSIIRNNFIRATRQQLTQKVNSLGWPQILALRDTTDCMLLRSNDNIVRTLPFLT